MVLNGHEIFALSPLVLLLVTIYLRLSSFSFRIGSNDAYLFVSVPRTQ